MSNLQPKMDLVNIVMSLNDELEERMITLGVTPEGYAKVATYMVFDLQAIRFNLCNDAHTVGNVWKVIRSQPDVLDLLVDLTTSLRLYADLANDEGWAILTDTVAQALGCFNTNNTDDALCALEDEGEKSRFVTPAEAIAIIESNPWWVTLFLLRRCPVVLAQVGEVSKKAMTANRNAAAQQQD